MSKLIIIENDGSYSFLCPGCNDYHKVSANCTFNGDVMYPTFYPAILIRTGHYSRNHKYNCQCNVEDEYKKKYKCYRCHSFITNGRISFTNDCSHSLAGKTVDLLEVEE